LLPIESAYRLPISPSRRHSNFGPMHHFGDIAGFCAHDPIPIPP